MGGLGGETLTIIMIFPLGVMCPIMSLLLGAWAQCNANLSWRLKFVFVQSCPLGWYSSHAGGKS